MADVELALSAFLALALSASHFPWHYQQNKIR